MPLVHITTPWQGTYLVTPTIHLSAAILVPLVNKDTNAQVLGHHRRSKAMWS